ncbi:MAG: hypothetical protein U1A78_01910 [Polyangia bacterium]
MRWAVFDELVARAAQDEAELRLARAEWGQATGKVHPEHELYAERSDAFLEWFVLERRAPAPSPFDGLTFVERELVRLLREGDLATAATCRALRAAHRSLFRVDEVLTEARSAAASPAPGTPAAAGPAVREPTGGLYPGELLLEDLLGGAQLRVADARLPFVQAGDLFEARVLPDPEPAGPGAAPRLVLGRAVLFHPRDAAKAVQDHIARAQRRGEPRTELLARLLRLRLRALAYRHVKPQRIYSQADALP